MNLNLRFYYKNDIDSISQLFHDTVHCIDAKDYSTEQLNVWATGNIDTEE